MGAFGVSGVSALGAKTSLGLWVVAAFGVFESDASATAVFAYNQGFYNLFLALVVAAGVVLRLGTNLDTGNALIIAGTVAMAGAAIVLVTRSPDKLRSAIGQGLMPAIAAIGMVLEL